MRLLRLLAPLLLPITVLTPLHPPASAASTATVWLNEFHYDNDGTDTGEFIEVANPDNVDLIGWDVVLYNGNGGTTYATHPLTGTTTFPVIDLAVDGLQNGAPDGIALIDGADTVIEFLSYEGTFTAADGPAAGITSVDVGVSETGTTPVGDSLQRIGTGIAPGDFTWDGPMAATKGALNTDQSIDGSGDGGDGGDTGACNDAPALVSTVQGSGSTSPCDGQQVTVEAVVTSTIQRSDELDGFFVQEEDSDADTDPATSEGVFVHCGSNCSPVAVGDVVAVTGTVAEYYEATQINATSASASIAVVGSSALPTATSISLDGSAGRTDAAATFETTEGMLVSFPNTLAVSEYYQLARYGSLVLTDTSRPHQFTHGSAPSTTGYSAFLDDLAARRIILDDDNSDQNDAITGPDADEQYYYPRSSTVSGFSTSSYVRGGDTIAGLTGVLDWSFDAWRIRPIPEQFSYTFDRANPRTTSPEAVSGTMTVASFNVLNYFTTVDDGTVTCSGGCRGADSEAELDRQRDKIVAALLEIDADVVGLVEIQNDIAGEPDAVRALVDALNAAAGTTLYDAIDTGRIGDDAIKQALIYQPAAVTPVGDHAILDSSVDPDFIDTKNRPALAQTFADAQGGTVTIAVNHLKSKGSSCDDLDDPDLGDGQANCNQTRTKAATALAEWLAGDPTGSGDPDSLVIGDLNAYRMEDPISALTDAGYVDLVDTHVGPDAYSYVFDGQLGYLDHALADDTLAGQVTGATAWHVNADEVPVLDYNDGVQDATEQSYERESNAAPVHAADAYRSSDHDPLLIGLDLTADSATDGVTLDVVGYKVKGAHHADLTWSGAGSTEVDVHVDGALHTTTGNDGAHTWSSTVKGGGSHTFQVCEAGSATCSVEAVVDSY